MYKCVSSCMYRMLTVMYPLLCCRELGFFFPKYTVPWVPGTEPPIQRTLAIIRPAAYVKYKGTPLFHVSHMCIYVCTYVCLYLHTVSRMYVGTYMHNIRTYCTACVFVCTCASMCACINACLLCLLVSTTYVCTHKRTYV